MEGYQTVVCENVNTSDRFEWIIFLRQLHINSGVWTLFFLAGLCVGAPTVFIPQLRKDGFIIDDELASWFYSVSNFTAIPWVLILPTLTRWTGRKPIYILTCVSVTAVHIILYCSTTTNEILAAGVIQGFANASNVTVITLVSVEYSSTRYRSIFMNITIASCFWGIWTSNAIGTYFYWKYIAVLGIICSVYTFSLVFIPESPVWLASKGKYKKTEQASKWLQGDSEESRKELQDVIKSQKNYREYVRNKRSLGLFAMIKSKEFYKPLLLCILIFAQYTFSGKYICSTCAIEIIGKMTDNVNTAQTGMLILDGVTILGMFSGSYLSRLMKRKTLYYFSAIFGVLFLLIISLYLYLVRLSILLENNILTILLLTAYSLSISCGIILAYPMYTEVIPIKYQRSVYMIYSLCLFTTNSVMLKLVPMALLYLGIDGLFLFNGVTCGVFTVILYFYMPDTEGKTILEIEEFFTDKKQLFSLKNNKCLMTQ